MNTQQESGYIFPTGENNKKKLIEIRLLEFKKYHITTSKTAKLQNSQKTVFIISFHTKSPKFIVFSPSSYIIMRVTENLYTNNNKIEKSLISKE